MSEIRVVHYLNQFFGQMGGEEKADLPPLLREGPVGPGTALQSALASDLKIVATVICGDTYFNENLVSAAGEVGDLIESCRPHLVIAGPAFNAGRYGIACAAVCKTVKERLNVPVITGMYQENPGVDMYRKEVIIAETGSSAAHMRQALASMARLASKLAHDEQLGPPSAEGYFSQGIRKNVFHAQRGSARAVAMLLKKIRQEDFSTEYPMPVFDRVEPRPPIKDLKTARIALVTSGGIVPRGNPDRIESSSASKFGRYDLTGVDDLTAATYETAHGGYDPVYANADADRVLPVDVLRDLEREGIIGSLHQVFYSTVGNGTSVAGARKFAQIIGAELKKAQIDGIILTST